ncbi:MFS transporter [Fictibacillus halophilus]|uniref:MFS transporter n=1 Tax=Fictibacillus halophilus TaxID=1610490 RepID=UPI001CFBA452|nr:MFS transporter [Fictibacillus halophilus]
MNYFSFHRNIQLRLALQFFTTLASSAVIPFLAIFFSSKVGEFATGLMYIGVILSGITGALLGGRRADQRGRKDTILLCEGMIGIGYLVAGISNLIYSLSPYANFGIFLVILFFTGMAGPAYGAVIIDASTKENRKAVYTVSYWLNNLAVAAGGIIGAFLFKKYPYEMFIGISLVALLSWVVTKIWLQDIHVSATAANISQQATKSWLENYRRILSNKRFVFFTIAGLFLFSLEESLTTYMGIKLVEEIKNPVSIFPLTAFFEVDGFQLIGLLKAENTILVVLLSLVIAGLLKKYQDRLLMLGGGFCYAFGFIVISYSSVPVVLIIAMFVATIGELAHIPAKQAYLVSLIPDDARGSYMAVYGLSLHFSGIIAALFVMLSGIISAGMITFLFVLMGVVSLIIYYVLFQTEHKEKSMDKTTA